MRVQSNSSPCLCHACQAPFCLSAPRERLIEQIKRRVKHHNLVGSDMNRYAAFKGWPEAFEKYITWDTNTLRRWLRMDWLRFIYWVHTRMDDNCPEGFLP